MARSKLTLGDLKPTKPGAAPSPAPTPAADQVQDEAPRRGRPPKRNPKDTVGLTLRLDRRTYNRLKHLTLAQKDARDDYTLTTHDLLLEAIDLLLIRHGEEASAVSGKAGLIESRKLEE